MALQCRGFPCLCAYTARLETPSAQTQIYKYTCRYSTHLLPPGGLPEMETAAFLKQTWKPTSKISCMVILWARAEGKSGWVQGGEGKFARNGIQIAKLFNPFWNSFFSVLENKQKRDFSFTLRSFSKQRSIERFNIALGCLTWINDFNQVSRQRT